MIGYIYYVKFPSYTYVNYKLTFDDAQRDLSRFIKITEEYKNYLDFGITRTFSNAVEGHRYFKRFLEVSARLGFKVFNKLKTVKTTKHTKKIAQRRDRSEVDQYLNYLCSSLLPIDMYPSDMRNLLFSSVNGSSRKTKYVKQAPDVIIELYDTLKYDHEDLNEILDFLLYKRMTLNARLFRIGEIIGFGESLVEVQRDINALRMSFAYKYSNIVDMNISGLTVTEISKITDKTPGRISQILNTNKLAFNEALSSHEKIKPYLVKQNFVEYSINTKTFNPMYDWMKY